MANAPRLSDDAANAAADTIAAKLNSGYLRVYDGVQAVNANTAITTQNKLAELRFQASAFLPSLAGVAVANALVSDTNTVGGVATWFRCLKSDGVTVVCDGSVDTSGADLNFNTTVFLVGGECDIANFSIQENES